MANFAYFNRSIVDINSYWEHLRNVAFLKLWGRTTSACPVGTYKLQVAKIC